jgi:hypothetical protein
MEEIVSYVKCLVISKAVPIIRSSVSLNDASKDCRRTDQFFCFPDSKSGRQLVPVLPTVSLETA